MEIDREQKGSPDNPEENISVINTNELEPDLVEVIRLLEQSIGKDNSAIVRVSSESIPKTTLKMNLKYPHHVSKLFQESTDVRARFPTRRKLIITSPTTWAVGAFDSDSRNILSYGLFTKLQGMYNERWIKHLLGFENAKISHTALPLEEVTGRQPGEVSVILERKYLQSCSVVDFDRSLIQDISIPERVGCYPIGERRFILARGCFFTRLFSSNARL